MSEMRKETNQDMVLFTQLFPKVIANHISKMPEFEGMAYADVLELTQDQSITMPDRLARIAKIAGQASLTDSLEEEASILWLCADGKEAEVPDPLRQAAYSRSDQNQILHTQSPLTLDHYLSEGIEVVFERDARVAMRDYCQLDTRDVPLIEKLKAKRLVNINGFNDSRIMYAVHDIVDHAWLFNEMRVKGIFEKYDDLLQRVEMGENTFLYSRQAELLASVGFGSRRWEVAVEQGEQVILSHRQIDELLKSVDDSRAQHAGALLEKMSGPQRQQALFMIENMAIQFTDERRRWGAVKEANEAGEREPMRLFDPLYIAMMVEALVMLQRSHTYGKIQLAATLEVESMLASVISDDSNQGIFRIPIPHYGQTDVIKLDHNKVDWIKKHISVSTSYNRIG